MFDEKKFIYSPDAVNDTDKNHSDNQENFNRLEENPADKEKKKGKTILEKIKEALQDWSNKDELDQQFDDTRV